MAKDEIGRSEALAAEGDAAAFGDLIRRFDGQLRSVVWSVIGGSQVEVDDVMQAAYEKALKSLASFDQRSSMKTWLYTICYRTALDQIRYEKRREHQDIATLPEIPASASTSGIALTALEIDRLFSFLSSEQRVLLMMTAGLGFSFDETAHVVGMKRGSVASKVSRVKAKLREENLL